jgi:hypothetical protein
MIAIGLLFVRMLCDCFRPRQQLEAFLGSVRHADRSCVGPIVPYSSWLYRRYPRILSAITVIRPETVLRWHRIQDCDIYTSCEPCPMCLGAIYWARLRRVYYANSRAEASQIGFDDGFIYGEVARVPELRKIPHFRLMTDDAQAAFKEWAASPEKIRY